MRLAWLGKTVALGGVLLALLWALSMVSGIVAERQGRQHEARGSVAESLAAGQRLVGPLIERQCDESWESVVGSGKERRKVADKRSFTLAATPRELRIDGRITIEPRYRGIFKVNGYGFRGTVRARWDRLEALRPAAEHTPSRLHCEAPRLIVAVGDARGLRAVAVQAGGRALEARAGTGLKALAQGFHVELPATLVDQGDVLEAGIELQLVGTEDFAVAPVGDSNSVTLASDWAHPSFQGRFLPDERSVREDGFNARWSLGSLATSAGHDLLTSSANVESFSVALIDPVNPYVLADRAAKYGLLFIVLTFVGVGLVEVLRSLRVHPVQYLLVGCALAVFFLLLVSLSEHIGFALAYLAAAAACTALLAYYGSFVLGAWRAGAAFGAAIALLYGALYALLQLEQAALMLGSLLLFAVLASVMVATRRVDWSALAGRAGLGASGQATQQQ